MNHPVVGLSSGLLRSNIHLFALNFIIEHTFLTISMLFFPFQGLRACEVDGTEFGPIDLPRGLKPVGPNISNNTLIQSIATALHLNNTKAIIGQTTPKQLVNADTSVFINPEQPLMHPFQVTDEDIRRQEELVMGARRKLQDAYVRY